MTGAEAAREVEITVDRMCREINIRARSYSARGLNYLRNAALDVLSHDGNYRRYKRRGGYHYSSAPGQPPAPDTGSLRRNFSQRPFATKGRGKWGLRIRLQIRSKMFYADFLQSGTRKMAARPFREPIQAKARPSITALYSSL